MATQLVLAVGLLVLGRANAWLPTRDAWLQFGQRLQPQPHPNHAYSMLGMRL